MNGHRKQSKQTVVETKQTKKKKKQCQVDRLARFIQLHFPLIRFKCKLTCNEQWIRLWLLIWPLTFWVHRLSTKQHPALRSKSPGSGEMSEVVQSAEELRFQKLVEKKPRLKTNQKQQQNDRHGLGQRCSLFLLHLPFHIRTLKAHRNKLRYKKTFH